MKINQILKIVREILLKSINESMSIFNYNFTIEQYAYDHVHSMINFENFKNLKTILNWTHNKNISGFEHIFKDFLIFKSFTKYSDYSFGESGSEPTVYPIITPFGQCLSFYKGKHKSNIRIDQIAPG